MSYNFPHIVWIYSGCLKTKLSAAPRLEVTRYLRRVGWKVSLINICPTTETKVRGVEVICIPKINVYFLGQLIFHMRALLYILKQSPLPDIIMFHQDSGIWIFPFIVLRRLFGKHRPLFVLDVRSVPMPDPKGRSIKVWLLGRYINLMNKVANYLADGQTAITERIAIAVQIPKTKLWGVWPSGAIVEQFNGAILKRQWPGENDPIELIYIGSMEKERNIMNLCRAVERVCALGMPFEFTLLGEGSQRVELEEFACNTLGRIKVFPTVPHNQVVDFLAKAHIGVLPFPDQEKYRVSSPVKLFEYIASGLAILATRIVCHTDVIKAGKYVFWVDGENEEDFFRTLLTVWERRASLPNMGREAGLSANDFSLNESGKKLKYALEYGLTRNK